MRAKPNRPINEIEIEVVRIALERCAKTPEARELLPTISTLRVIGKCDCGCATVDFARNTTEHPRPLADGIGIAPGGDRVGIIIWGVNDAITGLEVYDMSASASDLPLSNLKSIVSWDEVGA
jgi:hypothetical protein